MPEAGRRVRIGVLLSGRGSNLASLLAADQSAYEIVAVGSNVVDAGGLGIARDHGIETFARDHRGTPRADFDAWVDPELRARGVEAVALAGYMRILSAPFVAGWSGRMVNIHPSLLPLYKGLDTHARAIAAGDAEAGCSIHLVTAALDDGPVIAQARVPVLRGDTPDTLAARVLVAEHALYPRALADWVKGLPR